ncbi:MAG: hypothetical protein IT303_01845 [Dehalococcoidia bacterium]|nr:hypothetical protein [Dehalococcoidia bacterium]
MAVIPSHRFRRSAHAPGSRSIQRATPGAPSLTVAFLVAVFLIALTMLLL